MDHCRAGSSVIECGGQCDQTGHIQIAHGHPCTLAMERGGERAPDTARSPRHDDCFGG